MWFRANAGAFALLGAVAIVQAQSPASPAVPAPSGLASPWQAQKIVSDLIKDNQELAPLLDQIDPQQWTNQKGAPVTYIIQRQTAQQQIRDLVTTSKLLAQRNEDITLALDEYFRLEALEITARSLEDGAQRYADRQVASKMAQLIARNFNNREQFRNYLRDLATSTQQNFKIADEEAQRCRGIISKEPPPTFKRSKK